MDESQITDIDTGELASLLGFPTIQAAAWKGGRVEMLLNPVEMLKVCRNFGISLEKLAEIYCTWGASAK